jgi:hypothetical protein
MVSRGVMKFLRITGVSEGVRISRGKSLRNFTGQVEVIHGAATGNGFREELGLLESEKVAWHTRHFFAAGMESAADECHDGVCGA